MDDLDLLLADLGRPKSGVAKPAPAASNGHNHNSSKVNLNEIESLMSDLQTTQPATAHSNNSHSASQQAFESSDDLDALMESLNTSISTAVKTNEPAPAPKTFTSSAKPAPLHAAPVKTSTSTASVAVKKPQVSRAVLENTNAPAQKSTAAPAPIHSSSSNSTDDLDELLKNLNPQQSVVDYKQAAPQHHHHQQHQPQQHHQAARVTTAKPSGGKVVAGDDLDNLLTNLTSQMNDIDTSGPTPRGTCGHCRKPILGETIQAMGKLFHPEHFVCHNCHNPIGTKNFYEQENFPHCEKCYHELFCSRCAHCDDAITDRCITALGKKWHIHHFVCTQCLKPFEDGNFFERDGRPYCETDYYSTFATRCGGCNQPIRGECINALGTQWHPEHFVCQYCQKSFANGTFFEFGGKPYCDIHYHQQAGSVCSGCGKAVSGRCIDALDKKWHPEHFVCAFCMNPLAGGSYTANNGKPYCKVCHSKLFE